MGTIIGMLVLPLLVYAIYRFYCELNPVTAKEPSPKSDVDVANNTIINSDIEKKSIEQVIKDIKPTKVPPPYVPIQKSKEVKKTNKRTSLVTSLSSDSNTFSDFTTGVLAGVIADNLFKESSSRPSYSDRSSSSPNDYSPSRDDSIGSSSGGGSNSSWGDSSSSSFD